MPRFTFNPITGKLDLINSSTDFNSVYVNVSGDTMTGDLIFPVTGYIMTDSNGAQWRVTVDTTGAIVTTAVAPAANAPWLSLGFTNFDT